jgi:type II secretory pathway component PulL
VITGWLVKIVIVVGLLGVGVLEVGSPLITRAQVDGAAHDAADDAAAEYFQGRSVEAAKTVAEAVAAKEGAKLESFDFDPATSTVTVKLVKEARSIVMKKIKQTKSWYVIRVTASSAGPNK